VEHFDTTLIVPRYETYYREVLGQKQREGVS
jgi:hypothetical protein